MKLRIHYGITEKLRNYGKFTELRTGISDYGQNPKHYGFVPRVTPKSLLVLLKAQDLDQDKKMIFHVNLFVLPVNSRDMLVTRAINQ